MREGPGFARPFTPYLLRGRFAVQRRINFGDFGRLAGLVRRSAVVDTRLAAEVETEGWEVESVGAVGVDPLQRREQLLFGGRPHVRGRVDLVGRADLDR